MSKSTIKDFKERTDRMLTNLDILLKHYGIDPETIPKVDWRTEEYTKSPGIRTLPCRGV